MFPTHQQQSSKMATVGNPFPDSVVVMSSVLSRPNPEEQHVYQTRVGTYKGPTDIVELRPYIMQITPAGPGQAESHSIRRVVRSNGEFLRLVYKEKMFFSDGFSLPHPITISLEPDASYAEDRRTYFLNTQVGYKEGVLGAHAVA